MKTADEILRVHRPCSHIFKISHQETILAMEEYAEQFKKDIPVQTLWDIAKRIIQCQKGCFKNAEMKLIPDETQWEDLEEQWFDYLCDEFKMSNASFKTPIGGLG